MSSKQRQVAEVRSSQHARPPLRPWLAGACDLLFPPVCSLCGTGMTVDATAQRALMCLPCVGELTAKTTQCCRRCARPLPEIGDSGSENCPACREKQFHFDRAYALGVYDGRLRTAVLRMKQSTGEMLTLAVGQLLADHLADHLSETPDRIVAVPTHWARRLTRTTNCPEILMETLSRRLQARASLGLLRCRRKTKKQGTLLPTERQQNVLGAYAVSAGYDIREGNLLVVDDVMTTGATANEIAKVLRQAGARRVTVAAAARGVGFDG